MGSSFNNDIRFERFTGAAGVLAAGGAIGGMAVVAGTELGRTCSCRGDMRSGLLYCGDSLRDSRNDACPRESRRRRGGGEGSGTDGCCSVTIWCFRSVSCRSSDEVRVSRSGLGCLLCVACAGLGL